MGEPAIVYVQTPFGPRPTFPAPPRPPRQIMLSPEQYRERPHQKLATATVKPLKSKVPLIVAQVLFIEITPEPLRVARRVGVRRGGRLCA